MYRQILIATGFLCGLASSTFAEPKFFFRYNTGSKLIAASVVPKDSPDDDLIGLKTVTFSLSNGQDLTCETLLSDSSLVDLKSTLEGNDGYGYQDDNGKWTFQFYRIDGNGKKYTSGHDNISEENAYLSMCYVWLKASPKLNNKPEWGYVNYTVSSISWKQY